MAVDQVAGRALERLDVEDGHHGRQIRHVGLDQDGSGED
jgi:hypothetical protein